MIQRWAVRTAFAASTLCALPGCNGHDSERPRVTAKAGIFYGGQIQNRSEWPLVLDATRQSQGFRLEFGSPLSKSAQVTWKVVRPALRKKGHASSQDDAAESTFSASVPAGSERFDQVIAFTDSDRPGEWKLRVTVNGLPILERAIHVIAKPPANADD